METVEYIKDHINTDLQLCPEAQQQVAKTLLALLKIRKSENFMMQSVLNVSELEKDLRNKLVSTSSDSFKFVSLHETKKAAFNLEKLDDEEVEEIKKFLESLLEKKEGKTLQKFLEEKLGLSTKNPFDPDDVNGNEAKAQMAFLATWQSGNQEDIQLKSIDNIPESKVNDLITEYYSEKGFNVGFDLGSIVINKDNEKYIINISNFGNEIYISVVPM